MSLFMLIVVVNRFDFISGVRFDLVDDGVYQDVGTFSFQPSERGRRVVFGADRADRNAVIVGATAWAPIVGDAAVTGLCDRDVVVTECFDDLGKSLFAW